MHINLLLLNIKTEALNAVLASTREVVTNMKTMESWWTPVIDALRKVEDATHRNDIDDITFTVAITRITRALDSYYEAVSLGNHSGDRIQSDHAIVRGVLRRFAQDCFGTLVSLCLYVCTRRVRRLINDCDPSEAPAKIRCPLYSSSAN